MPLPRHDGSNTSTVSSSSDHAEVASVEPDGVLDLAGCNVHPDTVVNPDCRVGEADGPSIRCVQEGDILGTSLDLTDTAQLVLGLGCGDAVHDEPSLHVVDDAEVLTGLLNLDETLLTDGLHLLHGEGILQTVPQEKSYGKRLSLMVRTPPSLSSIHDLGAAKRFKCFLGPLGILRFYFSCRSESSNISL